MKKLIRLIFIILAALLLVTLILKPFVIDFVVGPQGNPEFSSLSPQTRRLVKESLSRLGDKEYRDYHVHVVGLGANETGCSLHPDLHEDFEIVDNAKFDVYKRACGISNVDSLDQQYIERLLALKRGIPHKGKIVVFAFDKYYNRNGEVQEQYTHFYVPNEYIVGLSEEYPEDFIPCVSIHPYRTDAVETLEKYGKMGIKQVKWLPNSMNINPADSAIIPYYETMRKYNMTLLTHAGDEHSVDTKMNQSLGNPLLLKLPLSLGVKVIVAHCASIGTNPNFEIEGSPTSSNFQLFSTMMNNKEYDSLLFADISATTLINRKSGPLDSIIANTHWHDRLLQGSDYPIPAIGILIDVEQLIEDGYLDAQLEQPLEELFEHNPLLFELVLKLNLHLPTDTNSRLSAKIFTKNALLGY